MNTNKITGFPWDREVYWPNWRRTVRVGQRVQHVRSGKMGTIVGHTAKAITNSGRYVRIQWDGCRPGDTGVIVSPAYELRVILDQEQK